MTVPFTLPSTSLVAQWVTEPCDTEFVSRLYSKVTVYLNLYITNSL